MARPLRIEYPGAIYHVITRGNNRQRVFRDEHDRWTYLKKLSTYCLEKEVELMCYCLLDNHIHLLVETPRGNLAKMMQPFQTSYTVYFHRRHGTTGHVFEQRYKALLVDKESYLLQVSRYIHLNPVGSNIVERPQDYQWSSYRGYLGRRMERGEISLNRRLVLGYFSGSGGRPVKSYRDFVEGGLKRGEKWDEFPITKQAFVGDDHFARETIRRVMSTSLEEGYNGLDDVVRAVSKVMGLEENELRSPLRSERTQTGREVVMYVARRHGDIGLKELVRFLGVKDISTVSHGVRRAEKRLTREKEFRNRLKKVLRILSHSPIQA